MIDIGLGHYLTLGAVIFSIGIIGILAKRAIVTIPSCACIRGPRGPSGVSPT